MKIHSPSGLVGIHFHGKKSTSLWEILKMSIPGITFAFLLTGFLFSIFRVYHKYMHFQKKYGCLAL